jgi:hypothetical protein
MVRTRDMKSACKISLRKCYGKKPFRSGCSIKTKTEGARVGHTLPHCLQMPSEAKRFMTI